MMKVSKITVLSLQ